VSFVTKPNPGKKSADGAPETVKKPTFRVLRKKASLLVKKKDGLAAKFSIAAAQTPIATGSNVATIQKPVAARVGATTSQTQIDTINNNVNNVSEIPSQSVESVQGEGATSSLQVSERNHLPSKPKPKPKTGHAATNRPVISSLFKYNPAIPVMKKETVEMTKENVFSLRTFSDLNLHSHLVATLEKDLEMKNMTEAQSRTIPVLLEKKDALVKSQTGSGKTLAYAIPIVEKLQCIKPNIDRTSGVFALVIVPTRELVLQTYSWFTKILKPFTWVVPGYLIGGEKKKSEKARIRKGMNILISTPGRLLDHLSSTKNLNLGKLHWLVFDEADRLFDMGYEKDVARIMTIVEEHYSNEGGFNRRQTVMVSATLTKNVEKLAGLALRDPVQVNMSDVKDGDVDDDQLVTPTNLKQWYIIVPPKLRLVTLAAFILWKCTAVTEKMVIFMTTQDMVDYHAELFNRVLAPKSEGDTSTEKKVSFYQLHGNMAQKDRTAIYKEFRDTQSGVLLCTDVAARGLDLQSVDWIVQYNPPVTAEEYVHRVGRTARVGKCGQAMIFLSPTEIEFVSRLGARGIKIYEKNPDSILKTLTKTFAKAERSVAETATALQLSFEESVIESYNLYMTATKGYVSFIRSYAAFPKSVRDIFNFQSLHLGHYAKSFALRDPPTKINSYGRNVKRDDKTKSFRTARQRNPVVSKPAATDEVHQPTFRERREMMSEFSSGFNDLPPPSKKMKSSF